MCRNSRSCEAVFSRMQKLLNFIKCETNRGCDRPFPPQSVAEYRFDTGLQAGELQHERAVVASAVSAGVMVSECAETAHATTRYIRRFRFRRTSGSANFPAVELATARKMREIG